MHNKIIKIKDQFTIKYISLFLLIALQPHISAIVIYILNPTVPNKINFINNDFVHSH